MNGSSHGNGSNGTGTGTSSSRSSRRRPSLSEPSSSLSSTTTAPASTTASALPAPHHQPSIIIPASRRRRQVQDTHVSSTATHNNKYYHNSQHQPHQAPEEEESKWSSSSSIIINTITTTTTTTRTRLIIKFIVSFAVLYSLVTSWTLVQWTVTGSGSGSDSDSGSGFGGNSNDECVNVILPRRQQQQPSSSTSTSTSTLSLSSPLTQPSLSATTSSAAATDGVIQDDPRIPLLQMKFVDHYESRRRSSRLEQSHDNNNGKGRQQSQQRPYKILCTSTRIRLPWGSYKLRCQDLQRYADQCVDPSLQNQPVEIITGIPVEFLDTMWNTPREEWSTKTNNTYPSSPLSVGTASNDGDDDNNMDSNKLFWNVHYDATIFVKSMSRFDHEQYGKRYIDLVDEYNWQSHNIPTDRYELILQTPWQGLVLFPRHKSSVVEHWYNSYPYDMMKMSTSISTAEDDGGNDNSVVANLPDGMPIIIVESSDTTSDGNTIIERTVSTGSPTTTGKLLRFATVWNTRRDADPLEGGCPPLDEKLVNGGDSSSAGGGVVKVTYDCLDLDFDITAWYPERMASSRMNTTTTTTTATTMPESTAALISNSFTSYMDSLLSWFRSKRQKEERRTQLLIQQAKCEMQQAISNPLLGTGKLYYNIFQQYDVLVVPVKNHTMKLHFGNVQRAVSQMRSGVPVLLEIRGKVLQDFVDRYNYTCAFSRETSSKKNERTYDNLESKLNDFLDEIAIEEQQEAGMQVKENQQGRRRLQTSVSMSGARTSTKSRKWYRNDNSKNNHGGETTKAKRKLWTFDEAVSKMKDPHVRYQCQQQGLRIAQDYSPSAIGQKFLRTVGYEGDFIC